jgi:hypothetical protein
MDLVQNAITAKASRIDIHIVESQKSNTMKIDITDNGKGMSKEILQKVTDPFFTSRTTRNVGLGIPLYKQHVEQCNGKLEIISEEGKGTTLRSTMELNHIDRQPMGDIAGVLVLLLTANPNIRFIYEHETDNGKYVVDTAEINNTLGTESVKEPGILKFIKEMIEENLKDINTP